MTIAGEEELEIANAEPKHVAWDNCIEVDDSIAHGPLKQTKREKRKMKKAKQCEELEYLQQVEERFQALNALLCEGSLTQEILVQLRREADAQQNAVDKQACDLPIY